MNINDTVKVVDETSEHHDQLGTVVFATDGEDLCVIELAGETHGTPFEKRQLVVVTALELENRVLRHIADSVEGLWAMDRKPADPDAFRLEFPELRRPSKKS